MKSLVLVLACVTMSMQTVYYVDCCCGDFCTHKNACTGCEEDQSKPCEVHPNHQAGGDCCNQDHSEPAKPEHAPHKKACAHMSPSSEITVQTTDAAPLDLVPLEFVMDLPVIQPLHEVGIAAFLIEKVPRPLSDVPRHLLLSVLQV
jgi:hypothetical protein